MPGLDDLPGAGQPQRPGIPSSPTLPASSGQSQGPQAGPPKNIPMGSGPVSGPMPGPSTGVLLPGYETIFMDIVKGMLSSGTPIANIQDLMPLIRQLTLAILNHFGTRTLPSDHSLP